MGQYRIQSESLGVDFLVEGDEAPNEKSTFEILKQVVPPDQMIKAYKGGNKDLARAAYKNGYFDQDSDTGYMMHLNRPLVKFLRDQVQLSTNHLTISSEMQLKVCQQR